jgi:hypothetical protein
MGKHDPFFTIAGSGAKQRGNPNATVQSLDARHFILKVHVEPIAFAIKQFLYAGKKEVI